MATPASPTEQETEAATTHFHLRPHRRSQWQHHAVEFVPIGVATTVVAADLAPVVMALKVATYLVTVATAAQAAWAPAVGLPMTLAAQQGSEFWFQAADFLQVAVEAVVPQAFKLANSIRSQRIQYVDSEPMEV
jgi:hypothetical protein